MISLLGEIKEGVAKNGFHEEYWLALLNLDLSGSANSGKSGQQQLDEWCEKNRLKYEVFNVPVPGKKSKKQQKLRFTKV